MALHLHTSMDALVVSSSLRALLAFSSKLHGVYQGSDALMPRSHAAMGQMLVGIPSRDASVISVLI